MPKFQVTSPEGKRYEVDAPEGASQDDAINYVQEKYGHAPPAKRGPVEKLFGIGGERYQTFPERVVRGVVGGVVGAVKTGAEMTGEALRGEATQESLMEDVSRGRVLGPASLGVSAAPGAARALAAPVEQFGERLARTYPEKLEEHARRKVVGRLEAGVKGGGPTAQEALEQINRANVAGKPMTLADIESLRGLAGNVARQPGASQAIAKQALYGRDAEAAQRLSGDIAQYVRGGPSMHQTVEALLQARSAAARPARAAIERLEGIWSPELQGFLDDPVMRPGMARGYEIARLEARAEGRPLDPTQLGVDLDAEGNIQILRTPGMAVLDMGKQGLDAMIASERNEITGRLSNRGVALDRFRRAYVELLDRLDTSGTYRAYREAWGGHSRSLDALTEGRSIFSNSPEQIAADFARLPGGDQEFYRTGVADLLRERLAKTGLSGDEAKSIIRNPWMRDQLRPIFRSDTDFAKFTEAVTTESRLHGTMRATLGGSQTAERVAEDMSQDLQMMRGGAEIATSLATGEWFGALRKYLRMKRDLGIRQNPELNERIAKLLFSTSPTLDKAGPSRTNYLETPANILRGATPALIPGAASSLLAPQE